MKSLGYSPLSSVPARSRQRISVAGFALLCCTLVLGPAAAGAQAAAQTNKPAQKQSAETHGPAGLLARGEAEKILPSSVFYRGQSATLQGRNSAGFRTADGKLVLVALVDTSGYSSSVAERYQAYLITEVPLKIGDKNVPPGAYGFGFIAGDRMVLMDIGGNELLATATHRDDNLKRPAPLQMLARGAGFELFLGRNSVLLTPGGR